MPYPVNVDEAFPLILKMPWAETLVVISRNQLFTFDLASGKANSAIVLLDLKNIQRVPANFPMTAFAFDGVIDPNSRKLLLATSTQEILSVTLDTQPLMVDHVVSLPAGWQFGIRRPILLHPTEKALYIQVKRNDTPITNGADVDEVWLYDNASWTMTSRLSLRELIANSSPKTAQNNSVTSYGLALSSDGQSVYTLAPDGLLPVKRDPASRPNINWLRVPELSSSAAWYAWYTFVP